MKILGKPALPEAETARERAWLQPRRVPGADRVPMSRPRPRKWVGHEPLSAWVDVDVTHRSAQVLDVRNARWLGHGSPITRQPHVPGEPTQNASQTTRQLCHGFRQGQDVQMVRHQASCEYRRKRLSQLEPQPICGVGVQDGHSRDDVGDSMKRGHDHRSVAGKSRLRANSVQVGPTSPTRRSEGIHLAATMAVSPPNGHT